MKPARKDPNSKASFNINDYRDIVETAAVTVDGLRTLTAEVREFAKSDELATSTISFRICFGSCIPDCGHSLSR